MMSFGVQRSARGRESTSHTRLCASYNKSMTLCDICCCQGVAVLTLTHYHKPKTLLLL